MLKAELQAACSSCTLLRYIALLLGLLVLEAAQCRAEVINVYVSSDATRGGGSSCLEPSQACASFDNALIVASALIARNDCTVQFEVCGIGAGDDGLQFSAGMTGVRGRSFDWCNATADVLRANSIVVKVDRRNEFTLRSIAIESASPDKGVSLCT